MEDHQTLQTKLEPSLPSSALVFLLSDLTVLPQVVLKYSTLIIVLGTCVFGSAKSVCVKHSSPPNFRPSSLISSPLAAHQCPLSSPAQHQKSLKDNSGRPASKTFSLGSKSLCSATNPRARQALALCSATSLMLGKSLDCSAKDLVSPSRPIKPSAH